MSKKILLISYYVPCRGHAGGLRLLDLYQLIRQLEPHIELELVACRHPDIDWGCELVDHIFDRVHLLWPENFTFEAIEQLGVLDSSFDVIDLQYNRSGAMISGLKRKCHGATIVFSPMESMVRAMKLYLLSGLRSMNPKRFYGHVWEALHEVYYVSRADKVVCVSEPDRRSMLWLKEEKNVYCLPTGLSPLEFPKSYDNTHVENRMAASGDSRSLVMVAYFVSKTNRDALLWFMDLVHPLIREKVPDYVFNVVGRGADALLIDRCNKDGVNFIGEVLSIERELISSCGGIAPALDGAGVRGKIHQYASVGLPCVASSLAALGLKYKSGDSILIADNPYDFAKYCIALLVDINLRTKIGQEAKRICFENYTWRSMINVISSVYELDIHAANLAPTRG